MTRETARDGSAAVRTELAGSRRGDARARAALMERIEGRDPGALAFLLSALPDIDEPKVLHHLANVALDDERPLHEGSDDRRRICDAAVEAFVTRLGLRAPTPTGGQYDPEQRAGLRQEMRSTLPM